MAGVIIRDPKLRDEVAPPHRPPELPWRRIGRFLGAVVAVSGLVIGIIWLDQRLDRIEEIATEARDSATANPVAIPETPTTAPPLDLPPADAETARRAIVGAVSTVFSFETPREVWDATVEDPGDRFVVYSAFEGSRCGAAVPVVTVLRFTDDDHAWLQFYFAGTGMESASFASFDGEAVRTPTGWKLTGDSVSEVLGVGAGYCGAT